MWLVGAFKRERPWSLTKQLLGCCCARQLMSHADQHTSGSQLNCMIMFKVSRHQITGINPPERTKWCLSPIKVWYSHITVRHEVNKTTNQYRTSHSLWFMFATRGPLLNRQRQQESIQNEQCWLFLFFPSMVWSKWTKNVWKHSWPLTLSVMHVAIESISSSEMSRPQNAGRCPEMALLHAECERELSELPPFKHTAGSVADTVIIPGLDTESVSVDLARCIF